MEINYRQTESGCWLAYTLIEGTEIGVSRSDKQEAEAQLIKLVEDPDFLPSLRKIQEKKEGTICNEMNKVKEIKENLW